MAAPRPGCAGAGDGSLADRGIGFEGVEGPCVRKAFRIQGGSYTVWVIPARRDWTRVCIGQVPWRRDPRFDKLRGLWDALGLPRETNARTSHV